MKIKRIYLEQFQQYRDPLTLDQFDGGINVIHGPNESGKSTLVRAIRAAFFERYSTGTAKDLQPWGDSGASPTIEVDFEHDGQPIRLKKRFLAGKRCDLQIDNEALSGEEAEERLANWLGYEYPGRGASKSEHWGVPGLLWVEQGTGQELAEAVENAQDHLEGALDNLLGEVASTGGDALTDAVREQRNQLLTSRGSPRGVYKETKEKLDSAREKLTELRQAVTEYQEEVDHLGRLQTTQAEEDHSRPWEAAQESLVEVQKQYDAISAQLEQQDALTDRLSELKVQRDMTEQQWRAHRAREDELKVREEQKTDARMLFDALKDGGSELEKQAARAREALEHARSQHRLSGHLNNRTSLERQFDLYEKDLQRQQVELEKAQQQQQQVNTLRDQASDLAVNTQALKALEDSEKHFSTLRIRKEAIATRLRWELTSGQHLSLENETGKESLQGENEKLLLSPTSIDLNGGGRLTITPGGEGADGLRHQIEEQEALLARQLRELGVETVDAARQQAREADRLNRDLQLQASLLKQMAPDGVNELEARHRETQREQERVQQQLDELPPLPEGIDTETVPGVEEASTAVEHAEAWLQNAEAQRREHERKLEEARYSRDAAEREWQHLHQEIGSEHYRSLGKKLEDQLAGQKDAEGTCERELEACRKAIEEARPELLEQDIERYGRTATTRLEQFRQREIEIHRLQSSLQARGAQGLEESLEEQKSRVDQLERRFNELAQQAEALELLYGLLNEKRQALIARLQAPLQKWLDHYLTMLFPQASLAVNDSLLPEQFSRAGNQGTLQELSFGAREQLGLISRLAYADLLRDAGRPTLIILDDSLVHSDAQRLDKMKRVLFDAAKRHQVLILTCHHENYQDLGVAPLDLQVLKSQAGSQ